VFKYLHKQRPPPKSRQCKF